MSARPAVHPGEGHAPPSHEEHAPSSWLEPPPLFETGRSQKKGAADATRNTARSAVHGGEGHASLSHGERAPSRWLEPTPQFDAARLQTKGAADAATNKRLSLVRGPVYHSWSSFYPGKIATLLLDGRGVRLYGGTGGEDGGLRFGWPRFSPEGEELGRGKIGRHASEWS